MQETTDQLVFALDQLHGLGNVITLDLLRTLDRLDRIGGWQEDGATSLENWVAFHFGMTWKAATEHVDVMRALRDLPATAAAFGTGRIPWDVLVLLCTFVAPDQDQGWADRAQKLSGAEVRMHARRAKRLSQEEADREHNMRRLAARWDVTFTALGLDGRLPGADGALVKKTLDLAADALGPGPDGVFAPYEQRLADALVEICATYAGRHADPDRATLVVHVEAKELSRRDGAGYLEAGPTISSSTLERLACDARIELAVYGTDGTSSVIGRTSRTVPAKMRREVFERDQGCANCGRTAGLHVHHVKHWAHGGRTEADNLALLCRRCHRLVHEGGFRLARDQHGRTKLIRRDGRPVMNRPAPLRPQVRERMLGPARARAPALRC